MPFPSGKIPSSSKVEFAGLIRSLVHSLSRPERLNLTEQIVEEIWSAGAHDSSRENYLVAMQGEDACSILEAFQLVRWVYVILCIN
jgi:hypothetical protein